MASKSTLDQSTPSSSEPSSGKPTGPDSPFGLAASPGKRFDQRSQKYTLAASMAHYGLDLEDDYLRQVIAAGAADGEGEIRPSSTSSSSTSSSSTSSSGSSSSGSSSTSSSGSCSGSTSSSGSCSNAELRDRADLILLGRAHDLGYGSGKDCGACQADMDQETECDGWLAAQQRSWDATRQARMRKAQAVYEKDQLIPGPRPVNGDETNIPHFIAMFSKTLPHNDQGQVDPAAYRHMRKALLTRNIKLLETVPQPGTLKFVQPLASILINLVGPAPSSLFGPPSPSMSSPEAAAEMVELYWMRLFMDNSLDNMVGNPLIAQALVDLNQLKDYKANHPVTAYNLFRGTGYGDDIGPYVSQFMYIDTPMWPGTYSCKCIFPAHTPANNRMITKATYLSVQNGTVTESGPIMQRETTYITTGRDLAHSVWQDAPGQWYQLAIRRAIHVGVPFSPKNPYNAGKPLNSTMDSFVNWNLIDVMACLNMATQAALSVAWYNKWMMFRRLRPEAYGNQVEQWRLTGENPAKIDPQLLNSAVLPHILAQQDNYYMAQCYQEGSPCHPSYIAGHATFSGASITILKAFFQNDWEFPTSVVPAADGKTLVPLSVKLTFAGEVNKLGSNVAIGRDWAGVHYLSDGHQGILMGEQVGIRILQDWLERYPEPDVCFRFTGYQGNEIVIVPRTPWGRRLNPFPVGCTRKPRRDEDKCESSSSSDSDDCDIESKNVECDEDVEPHLSDKSEDDEKESVRIESEDDDSSSNDSDDSDEEPDDSDDKPGRHLVPLTWNSDDDEGYRNRYQGPVYGDQNRRIDGYSDGSGVTDRYRDGSYH